MSEKMTTIHLAGLSRGEGFMHHGEMSAEYMIQQMRQTADRYRAVVAEIDAALDEDFQIDLVRGVHVQHHIRNIQPGRRHESR